MHICHIITRLIIGGAQENTILSCRGLVDRGHRVTLVSGPETGPEGSLWEDAEQAGCEVIKLDSLCRAISPLQDWKAIGALESMLRFSKPDVVHTHSSKAGIIGREAAARAGVPAVVHTIHGMSFNRTQPFLIRSVYRMLERRAAPQTTMFVSVANAMTRQAVDAGIALPDRFVTVYSGMETGQFQFDPTQRDRIRQEWGFSQDDVVVGTIARLFDNKGYDEIIDAMPRAIEREPSLKFVWIGDGANRTKYEMRLEALDLRDRVTFTGLIEPHKVAGLMNGFDMVVHASRWEGLPRALVQGLLMERPVISFDNDGAPEVVIPNETGCLIRQGDIAGLSEAIVELAQDPLKRDRFGQNGRKLCIERFDWRKMVDDLDALYLRLTDPTSRD